MNLWKRYLGGMITGAGSVILKTGLNMLVIPVLIAHLGLDYFGLYILLLSLLESSILAGLGLNNGLTKTMAETDDPRPYLRAGHVLFGILSVLMLAVGLLLWPRFSHIFHLSPALTPTAQLACLLMLFEAVISVYACYYQAVLLAHCSHQWTNLADTLYNLISNAGALMLLFAGYHLPAVLAVRLLGAVVRLALMAVQARKLEPEVIVSRAPFCWTTCGKLLHISFQGMMINFSVIVSHKVDALVIARFLPISAVGVYEIVFRFLGITNQICLKLSEGTFPLFARLFGEQRKEDAAQLFLRMSSFLNMVAAMMLMLIVFYYHDLFAIFSAGRIPVEATLPILALAVPCVLSGTLQMPAGCFLFTWGHPKFLTVSSLIAACCNFTLSLILVQKFGIMGVAVGTMVPAIIQHQASLIRKVCHELGISFGRYMAAVHGTVLIPLLTALVWVSLWKPALDWSAVPLLTITLVGGSAALIGGGLWFALSASPLERDILAAKVLAPLRGKFLQPGTKAFSGDITG